MNSCNGSCFCHYCLTGHTYCCKCSRMNIQVNTTGSAEHNDVVLKFFLGLTKLSARFVWLHQVSFFFSYSRIECKAVPMCRTEEWAKHRWPTITSQNLQPQRFLVSLNCNRGKKLVKRHTINKSINQHSRVVLTEDIICPWNGRKILFL